MDSVRLLNRLDTKFVVETRFLPLVLGELAQGYRALTLNGSDRQPYETLYFDTRRADMYLMHHNGYAKRVKVRKRWYIDSGIAFVEVKRRTNTKRTIKKRIQLPDESSGSSDLASGTYVAWLKTHCPYDFQTLVPKTWTRFDRLTLVNHELTERVTVDYNLRFRAANETSASGMPGDLSTPWSRPERDFCVIEVKRGESGTPSLALQTLRNHRAFPTSFSKYCIGTALLDPTIKQNQFKPMLRTLGTLTS
jgi:hypothetical protein